MVLYSFFAGAGDARQFGHRRGLLDAANFISVCGNFGRRLHPRLSFELVQNVPPSVKLSVVGGRLGSSALA